MRRRWQMRAEGRGRMPPHPEAVLPMWDRLSARAPVLTSAHGRAVTSRTPSVRTETWTHGRGRQRFHARRVLAGCRAVAGCQPCFDSRRRLMPGALPWYAAMRGSASCHLERGAPRPAEAMVVGDRPRAAVCGGGIDRTTEPRGSWSVARIAAALGFFSFTSSRPLAGCGVSLVRLLTLRSTCICLAVLL